MVQIVNNIFDLRYVNDIKFYKQFAVLSIKINLSIKLVKTTKTEFSTKKANIFKHTLTYRLLNYHKALAVTFMLADINRNLVNYKHIPFKYTFDMHLASRIRTLTTSMQQNIIMKVKLKSKNSLPLMCLVVPYLSSTTDYTGGV